MENPALSGVAGCLDPTGSELRRCRTDMLTAGFAVILLGVWSVIKAVYYTYKSRQSIMDTAALSEDAQTAKIVLAVTYALIVLMFLLIAALRLYVGRRAIKEGWGLSKKRGYLVIVVIMLLSAVLGVIGALPGLLMEDKALESFAQLCLEVTDIYALGNVIMCSHKLKKLYAAQAREKES